MTDKQYRGRIAPSPTGLLHIGHAVTFWRACERACAAGGKLVLRIEDLDRDRCRREFADAIIEDLHWFGLDWDEGPDIGGPFASYIQSQRRSRYLEAWEKLRLGGLIYPCKCSRKDVADASLAPHDENEEPMYPGTCRPRLQQMRRRRRAEEFAATRCLSSRHKGNLPPVTAAATSTTKPQHALAI
jgi:glutamyl-tRNA synthetase